MKCQQTFSQAPPQRMILKENPRTSLHAKLSCLVSYSSLIASLLPKFLLNIDTGSSKASPNTLRSYCIYVFFDSCRAFKESDSGFLKWSFPDFVWILFVYNIPLSASSLLHAVWHDSNV